MKTKSSSQIGAFFTRFLPNELALKTILVRVSERENFFAKNAKIVKMVKLARMAKMTKLAKIAKMAKTAKMAKIAEIAETEVVRFLKTFKNWVFFEKKNGFFEKT